MDFKSNKIQSIKRFSKEIAVALLILFVVSNIISYLRKPRLKDESLPTTLFQTIDGEELSFTSYEGKPTLVHFWATWCPVCKVELSNIERVSKKYQVVTVAVQSGDDNKIKAFMKERGANFTVVNDREGELSQQFSVELFPTTFIYNSGGELLFSEVGYTSTAGLLARMAIAD
ncbi:MAG: protein disulfide oxidoreductase [Campylobacterota bacterium]|nr:protein disulfide oxidoreductase [Campylobacterota bacterium]